MSICHVLLSESVVLTSLNAGGIQTVKPETIRKYRVVMKNLITVIGDIDCGLVTAPLVLEWQKTAKVNLSPISTNNYLHIYRGIFKELVRRGVLNDNPFTHVPVLPEPALQAKSVDDEHFKLLVKRSPLKQKAILWLLWDTGARPRELCRIHIDKIEITEGENGLQFATPVVGKFDKERWIFARHEATQAVLNYMDVRHPSTLPNLFLGRGSEALKPSGIYQGIKRIQRRCPEISKDVKINAQMFRPTFVHRMWREGYSIAFISKALGHTDPSFTIKRYFRPTKEQMKDAYFSTPNPYAERMEFSPKGKQW